MKLPGCLFFAVCSALALDPARAADATTPVDYTERNAMFSTRAIVVPEKKSPSIDRTVQDQRFEAGTVDRKMANVGGRRAPVDVGETREKNLREKESQRPVVLDQPTSAYNQRASAISTTDSRKPDMVTRFQESLTAASASNMARFPALDKATTAKVNRFVFRKNPSEAPLGEAGSAITPAGGTPVVGK